MYYTVYKITNLINNKIYIGVHKTSNLEDNYMGSGLLIRKAIERYGIENFKKEYISIFDNAEDMFKMESELVNEDFLERNDVYNLKSGGFGGWDYVNCLGDQGKRLNVALTFEKRSKGGKIGIKKAHETIKIKRAEDILYDKKYRENIGKTFLGKKHTEEAKKRIGEASAKHQSGEKNSQFGTMWIHNLELKESKKIKKEEFSSWEQDGWLKGRKMKF